MAIRAANPGVTNPESVQAQTSASGESRSGRGYFGLSALFEEDEMFSGPEASCDVFDGGSSDEVLGAGDAAAT